MTNILLQCITVLERGATNARWCCRKAAAAAPICLKNGFPLNDNLVPMSGDVPTKSTSDIHTTTNNNNDKHRCSDINAAAVAVAAVRG